MATTLPPRTDQEPESFAAPSSDDRPIGAPAPPTTPGAARPWLLAASLVLLTGLVFANGIRSPFYLDDENILERTPTVRTFGAAWNTSPTRRVGMLSFALNYRVHGLNLVGFHATNIAIHAAAGLALFGLVRGTLRSPSLQDRFGDQADWLAWGVAALWLLHPLQTGAVTYTIQRFESLMGLWFLLSMLGLLYGATRSASGFWYALCLVAAILGAQTKEVLAVLPVVALAYDRIFLANGWRDVARRRGWVHGGLVAIACWMVYASRAAFDPAHGGSAGFGLKRVTPWEYLSSQAGVLLHYLKLTVWPDRLCFDYLWPVARSPGQIYPQGLVILALLALTVWALWRRPALGFLGLCWFAILAPTSSVVPIADLAFEHRMYLPLAPLVTLGVLGAASLTEKFGRRPHAWMGVIGLAIAVLAVRTVIRNADYNDPLRLWKSVLAVNPGSYRAHNQLAQHYQELGRLDEAEYHFLQTKVHKPDAWWVDIGLGNLRVRQARFDDAERHFEAARQSSAGFVLASANLARLRERQSRWDEAVTLYEAATRKNGSNLDIQLALAAAYQRVGRDADAQRLLKAILKRDPRSTEATRQLAALKGKSRSKPSKRAASDS